MYYDFKVKIPIIKGKIYERKIKGVTYINYEYDRVYKPDKKYNIPKRTTIGKKCDDDPDMMYPNPNYLTYFPDAELPTDQGRDDRSSCLRVGAWIVLEKLIRESLVDKLIHSIYEDERGSGLFLDLVSYYIVTENNVGQYYPDYAYNHPLFTPEYKIYSDSTVSTFTNQITVEESVQFQNEWNSIKKKKDKIYISYDSTNKNCQAGEIDIAEFGHAKEDKGLPIINYSVAYDCKNREPLFYELYPGSIVDVSQLQCMLNKAVAYGYKDAGFILDRGYFSRENIRYMDKCGYDFVIMVKGMRSFVQDKIKDIYGTFEDKRQNTIRRYQVNGITVKTPIFYSDEKDRYLHIYYSYGKAASERSELESKIDKIAAYLKKLEGMQVKVDKSYEKYFSLEYYHEGQDDECFVCGIEKSSVIEEELKMCGYFCIITSEDMTAKEALELYKSRDASEKLFKSDKSFLGNRSMRIHSGDSLEGKMLIAFVALIIRNRMYTKLKDTEQEMLEKPNYMNVPASIRELEKIEMIRQADGVYRMDHALTATQKTILKAFGIDANYVKRKVREISDQLKYKA
ncbi:MAG: transposase [Eubacteriales bacterium]|nr:transposase [Eubacteriales bacterium]